MPAALLAIMSHLSVRRTWRRAARVWVRQAHRLIACSLFTVIGCDDGVCTMIDTPEAVHVVANEVAEVQFEVNDQAALPVRHQALIGFRAFGETDGIHIWRANDHATECVSMPSGSSTSCSFYMEIGRGQPARIALRAAKPGCYELEGNLQDFTDPVSLLDPPVCSVHARVTVDPAGSDEPKTKCR